MLDLRPDMAYYRHKYFSNELGYIVRQDESGVTLQGFCVNGEKWSTITLLHNLFNTTWEPLEYEDVMLKMLANVGEVDVYEG